MDESANNVTHDKNKLSYALTSYNKETIGFELYILWTFGRFLILSYHLKQVMIRSNKRNNAQKTINKESGRQAIKGITSWKETTNDSGDNHESVTSAICLTTALD